MSYAIIFGAIFAWVITLLWAGKELSDARRRNFFDYIRKPEQR